MSYFKTLCKSLLAAGLLSLPMAGPALASEQAVSFVAYQQQTLPGKIAWPEGLSPAQVKDWIVLLHGSGAPNMDEDLAEATVNKQPNPFFKFLSDQLIKQGFGVIRYDKRSYLISQKARQDPAYAKSDAVQAFVKQPLTFLIEDGKACVKWAHQQYPQARIHVLGHSEGTYVALQLAQQLPKEIQGVGLIGFYDTSFDTTVFEQTVYRPEGWFRDLDLNHNLMLSASELNQPEPVASQLKSQMAFLDRDHDQQLSLSEFRAASLMSSLVHDLGYMAFRQDEAHYPRPHQILPTLTQPVVFFVGSLDNQTPAYQTQAVEMANQAVWQKNNFYFNYFTGLGHGLDKRSRYEDVVFQLADPSALAKLSARLAEVLKK